MKKCSIVQYVLAMTLTHNAGAVFSKVQGIDDVRIKRVAVSKADPSFLTIASDNALYVSKDGGDSFRKKVVLKDEQAAHIVIDPHQAGTLYLAGTRNCYKVGETTKRIFSGDNDETINFIAKHCDHIYVATSAGLYFASEALLNWKSVPGLSEHAVYSTLGSPDGIYASSDKGVHLYKPDGALLRKVFTKTHESNDETYSSRQTLSRSSPNSKRLWLYTNRGLFHSNNSGENWKRFYIAGANNLSINCMMSPPSETNRFFICSDDGLFAVNANDGSAQALYEGLPTSKINWMDFGSNGEIYLATDKGLFTNKETTKPKPSHLTMQMLMEGEPTIQEVQEAALRYNMVHPEKIRNWSRKIKYRALAPRLSIDYDKTIGSSFTQNGYYYAEGPHDWGVSLSWDLGNLIWNSYEDDIDNRNKYMNKTRTDILDEVNRLYFERLRFKRKIMAATLGDDTMELKFRLHELTAMLDGTTGGLFTRNRKNPNFTDRL